MTLQSHCVYLLTHSLHAPQGCGIFNPRHACAARVTVLSLCVCLCVCVCVCVRVCLFPRSLPLRTTRRPRSNTDGFGATLSKYCVQTFWRENKVNKPICK